MKSSIGWRSWLAGILNMCGMIRRGRVGHGLLPRKAERKESDERWNARNVTSKIVHMMLEARLRIEQLLSKPHDVISAIDENHFAGDAAAGV